MNFLGRLRVGPFRKRGAGRNSRLETILGYRFRQPALLDQALTHRSITDLHTGNLERLEFLGDAVLGHVVSLFLYREDSYASEGELTMRRSAVVNKDYLAEAGETFGLHDFLNTESGVRLSDSKVRRNLVGDAVESLIGALFLDGGIKVAEKFILDHILSRQQDTQEIINYKGDLIELCHQRELGPPRFKLLKTLGPEHDKHFVVQVRVGQQTFKTAEADTKKAAEQAAAELALAALKRGRRRRR